MIKFFRKIRQKLIVENRFNKYLLYAIGEIVLVVIGILIALQINNWNEHKKVRKKATVYIDKIVNDLKVDTLNINKLILKVDKHKDNISKYYEYFNSADTIDISIEELRDSINKLKVLYVKYYPVNKTFKDMESSGSSDLLSDSQRNFLIKLASNQQELEIINKSYIDQAVRARQISSQLLGANSDFYKKLKINNSKERKTQGLLHLHLYLDALDDLYYYIKLRGQRIKKQSLEAIHLLKSKSND